PGRREVDLLGEGGAVEAQRVAALLTLDDVAAVARIPDEDVIPGAHHGKVAAFVAVDQIVPCATAQSLGSRTSEQGVVAVSTVDRRRDGVGERAVDLVDTHEVVAGPAVDGDARDALPREAEVG